MKNVREDIGYTIPSKDDLKRLKEERAKARADFYLDKIMRDLNDVDARFRTLPRAAAD